MLRKLLVLTTAIASMAVMAAAAAPGAGALTLTSCTGTNSVTYSPALTNTTQTTTITSGTSWPSCTSTSSAITSGSTGNQISKAESCMSLLGGFSSSNTITWNTGQTSTFSFSGSTEEVDGQYVIILTGSITAGLFSGATALEQTTLTGDLSACSGAGIASNSGPSLLQIAGL